MSETRTSHTAPYHPGHDQSPPNGSRLSAWGRPERILALIALGSAIASALNLRRVDLEPRVAAVEHGLGVADRRVDSLGSRLELVFYMQCVQLRRTDPEAVPPGCPPVAMTARRP